MGMIPTPTVVIVTYIYSLSIIGVGAFGLYSKGSKCSLFCSTLCALVPIVFAQLENEDVVWYLNAVYCLALASMFYKQSSGAKAKADKGTACPVTGDAEAVPVKEGDAMNKFIREAGAPLLTKEEQEIADKNTNISRQLFLFLVVFSVVECLLSLQLEI